MTTYCRTIRNRHFPDVAYVHEIGYDGFWSCSIASPPPYNEKFEEVVRIYIDRLEHSTVEAQWHPGIAEAVGKELAEDKCIFYPDYSSLTDKDLVIRAFNELLIKFDRDFAPIVMKKLAEAGKSELL